MLFNLRDSVSNIKRINQENLKAIHKATIKDLFPCSSQCISILTICIHKSFHMNWNDYQCNNKKLKKWNDFTTKEHIKIIK